mmetsp:Transcript_34297/g.74822  ORF Transcript_34297/g.74822 Transcript_34297/m.74822 type:complete len:94 (+) Transcript_34297:333-614(+)|eukprot:CAMPEP_0116903676 /NCGR_PEP_ID=MMETSP0467-20121206/10893_1 /TAXON_ID=283647 /ORGANISM="Mesodinium pulex, Strain SPMC105" /LENGTH=93 /DNA_ID=CAMNT_0004578031 /DNA_START=276 /DNA_END=557 /DNA_ORIENTATION=+
MIENASKYYKDDSELKEVYVRCKRKFDELTIIVEELFSQKNFNWDHNRVQKMITKGLRNNIQSKLEHFDLILTNFKTVGDFRKLLKRLESEGK